MNTQMTHDPGHLRDFDPQRIHDNLLGSAGLT